MVFVSNNFLFKYFDHRQNRNPVSDYTAHKIKAGYNSVSAIVCYDSPHVAFHTQDPGRIVIDDL